MPFDSKINGGNVNVAVGHRPSAVGVAMSSLIRAVVCQGSDTKRRLKNVLKPGKKPGKGGDQLGYQRSIIHLVIKILLTSKSSFSILPSK